MKRIVLLILVVSAAALSVGCYKLDTERMVALQRVGW